jgi:hypothetical protein
VLTATLEGSGKTDRADMAARANQERKPSASVAVATPAAATTTASATSRSFLTRPGFIHRQSPALEVLLMKHGYGLTCIFRGRHLNKSKAAGSARSAVLHDVDCNDSARLCEVVLQIVFSCRKR